MAALRCRVGDLVVIVDCQPFPQNIGRFATVESAVNDPALRDVGADWWIKPQTTVWGRGFFSAFESSKTLCVRDSDLRPIRDPGDDAVDETLIYAGDPRVRELSHG